MKRKKLMVKLACLAAALLLLLAAAGYTLFLKPGTDRIHYVYKEEKVERGDVVQGVMESGNLSMEERSVSYELSLQEDEEEEDEEEEDEEETARYLVIESVYAVPGQRIQAGDPLFSFTQKSITSLQNRLESRVTEAQIALTQAQAAYETSLLSAKNTYEKSKLSAESAAAQLEASRIALQEEINSLQAQAAVLELEVNQCLEKLTDEDFLDSYQEAQQAYEKAKKVLEETDRHAAAAYAANYAAYVSAAQAYETLQEQKDGWEETIAENQETIASNNESILEGQEILETRLLEMESTYELSEESGELAAEIYAYTKETLEESVSQAQDTYEETSQLLADFKSFVGEDGILYAQEDGLVTAVFYEEGDKLTQTGTMLSYARETDYTVSVDVSEEDIAAIRIGDAVQVAFDAYPGGDFAGTVQSVTTTKTSDHAATVSYPVKIAISGDTQKLYGGMTVEITFVSSQAQDVLYVSKKAIVEEGGKTYVYVEQDGEKKLKEVETGFENSTLVEIREGLSEGEVIYIRSQASEELQ